MDDFIKRKISESASTITDEAFKNIISRLPDEYAKQDFINRMKNITAEGVETIIDGREYQNSLEKGAYAVSIYIANHYADAALSRVCQELPQGTTRQIVTDVLYEISRSGIEVLCSGGTVEDLKAELSLIPENQVRNFAYEQIRNYSQNFGDGIYKKIKFTGSGSRSKNRYLREGTDMLTDEFAFQVANNMIDIFNGRKNFGGAAKDIVIGTGKNTAVTYTKRQGAKMAATAIKSLSKLAEKEIENVVAKNAVTEVLKKLANANVLLQVADVAYDIGKSFKRWLDGEIDGTQFLWEAGEKGTAVIVSGVFATLGAGIAGQIGAAVGSAAGYFATHLLYGSVMQAFEEAELSRKRYEVVRAFCEESIREMEIQRQEFENNVAQFLSHRQAVIDNSLNAFEAAMRNNDMTGVSSALNGIAREFGGELQFKNRAEFDKFMLDKNSVFVL